MVGEVSFWRFPLKVYSRRQNTATQDDDLKAFMETNPSQAVDEIEEGLEDSKTGVTDGWKGLVMEENYEEWVPHDMSDRQRLSLFEICLPLLHRNQNDPFLALVVTCDEKYGTEDDQDSELMSTNPQALPKPKSHPKKTMVTVRWWLA